MIINNVVSPTGFTQINNGALRDRRLSAAARGILAYLLSHSGKFEVKRATVQAEFNISRDKTVEYLGELQKFGYLDVNKAKHFEDGTWAGKEWSVFGTSQLPDVEGAPKRKKGNCRSFSEENNPNTKTTEVTGLPDNGTDVTAKPDNGFAGRHIEEQSLKNKQERRRGRRASTVSNFQKEPKQNSVQTKQEETKTTEQFLNADSPNTSDSKPTGSGINTELNKKSNHVSNINSDLNQRKEVPVSILIYKELCEDIEPSDAEVDLIVKTVKSGTEAIWREVINAYQTERVKKGYGSMFYVQGFIDRFKAKMISNRISKQIQATAPQKQGGYVNPDTGNGYL